MRRHFDQLGIKLAEDGHEILLRGHDLVDDLVDHRHLHPDNEVICYRRPDVLGTKQSEYIIAPVTAPERFVTVLSEAFGTEADLVEDAYADLLSSGN